MNEQLDIIQNSDFLDANWYLSEYPDVGALKMEPAAHYLYFGATLQRDPGPNFSTSFYMRRYPDVVKAGINPLYHYLMWGEKEGREIRSAKSRISALITAAQVQQKVGDFLKGSKYVGAEPRDQAGDVVSAIELPDWHGLRSFLLRPTGELLPLSVEDLEVKLWGGYSKFALNRLERLKRDARTTYDERANIGWHLARWYAVEQDHKAALTNLRYAKYYCSRVGRRAQNARRKIAIAEAQCLAWLGKYVAARKVLRSAMDILGESPNFWLGMAAVAGENETIDASSMADRDAPLFWINKLYQASQLVEIQKIDDGQPLSFFNVTTSPVKARPLETCPEKVSVVIPAYNAAETIHISLTSLLQQTWSNLEIIVVDDCSTDTTADVVERFSRLDSRIRLIRKEVNGGAYPARNLGLRHVTGDLIMVHDSDDWSHPQKVEMQIAELRQQPSAVGAMSHWVRFNEHLRPVGPWRPTGNYFDLNFSSLMVRRHVVDSLGGWDEVRISGDAEYRYRILRRYGEDSIVKVESRHLLSLSLSREDSLTQTKVTHLRSLDFGLRWLYRDAYRYWHASGRFDEQPKIDGTQRPFPAPHILRSRVAARLNFDLIVATDLSHKPYVDEILPCIKDGMSRGCSIGLVHWPRFDRYVHMPIQGEIYDLCCDEKVSLVTNGEVASTRTALLPHPEVAQFRMDQFPEIEAGEVLVIAREFPIAPLVPDLSAADASHGIQSNIRDLFGKPGIWAGRSVEVQKALQRSELVSTVSRDIWLPVLPGPIGKLRSIASSERRIPVAGRYCEVEVGSSWPRQFREAKRGYCADSEISVRFVADQDMICSHFGRSPKNWSFETPGETDERALVSDIDFYLYYPDKDYHGEIEPAVFLAMARGVVVVAPKRLGGLFGNAIACADADRAEEVVLSLWRSKRKYREVAQAGRSYVKNRCMPETFFDRLDYFASADSRRRRDSRGG